MIEYGFPSSARGCMSSDVMSSDKSEKLNKKDLWVVPSGSSEEGVSIPSMVTKKQDNGNANLKESNMVTKVINN